MAPGGTTIYLAGSGIFVEQFIGSGGTSQWNNYLFANGQLIGMRVELSGGTVNTRYFNKDHLGSIATITDENGVVQERLAYDAWGKRRYPDGSDDPSNSITSQTSRGFTGHEELDSVTLVHMNGRVYDPLLGRFGVPDPTTESPFSTQGWNRYSYVGNSPVNFTDPTGYCFMGCFWKPIFSAIGKFIQKNWGAILEIAATALCMGNPVCGIIVASLTTTFVVGVTSGNLGLALRAGLIAGVTAAAFFEAGELTGAFGAEGGVMNPVLGGHGPLAFGSDAFIFNVAAHALIGCASAVASNQKCGAGALSGGAGAFAGPFLMTAGIQNNLVVTSIVGGLASVAGGGKFANGAVTAAFGYLFNQTAGLGGTSSDPRDLGRYYSNNDNLRLDAQNAPDGQDIKTWTIGPDDDTQIKIGTNRDTGQPVYKNVLGWQLFDLPGDTTVQGILPNTDTWTPPMSVGTNGAILYYNPSDGKFFAKVKESGG